MRRIIGTIGATLAIVGVMAAFNAPGVFSAIGTRSGGETISDSLAGQLFENPAGGPYFGKLDPTAHYYVKIDNTGDGVESALTDFDVDPGKSVLTGTVSVDGAGVLVGDLPV